MFSNDDFEIDKDMIDDECENEREDCDGPDHPFVILSVNIERMISRRSGAYVHQSEEEDIMAIYSSNLKTVCEGIVQRSEVGQYFSKP